MGKIVVGVVTGDTKMVVSATTDIVLDAAAMAIPYVPAGLAKLDDAAKVLSKADEALDVVKATDKAVDTGKAARNAAGEAADAGKLTAAKPKGATAAAAEGKTHQTYTKTNPSTGQVYSGRTSGTGTPAQKVARRDAGHHKTADGFGPARLDKSSSNAAAIRGREQQLLEAAHGGAKSRGGPQEMR